MDQKHWTDGIEYWLPLLAVLLILPLCGFVMDFLNTHYGMHLHW